MGQILEDVKSAAFPHYNFPTLFMSCGNTMFTFTFTANVSLQPIYIYIYIYIYIDIDIDIDTSIYLFTFNKGGTHGNRFCGDQHYASSLNCTEPGIFL